MLRKHTSGKTVGHFRKNRLANIIDWPLFSSSIVAEMSADAEYQFIAFMQESAFIYPGFEN